jgi:Gpi18-like mannosyltransferase
LSHAASAGRQLQSGLWAALAKPSSGTLWYAGIVVAGLLVRIPMLPFLTGDMDVHLLRWFATIDAQGAGFLRERVADYAPIYELYFWLLTNFDGLASPMTLIKLSSLPFELSLAFAIGALVRACGGSIALGRLGFAIAFLLPTGVLNAAAWGQCDAIYVSFLAWCLWSAIKRRPLLTMAMFSAALAFKLQAAWIGPVLLWLALKGRQPWWTFAFAPVGYLIGALPVLIAGRDVADTLFVYGLQAGTYRELALNAASLYALIPDSFYDMLAGPGVIVAGIVILAVVTWLYRTNRLASDPAFLIGAAALLMLVPFITPKMHDRYFYASDFVLIAVALVRPRLWPALVLAQIASLLSYAPFLMNGLANRAWEWPPLIERQMWRIHLVPILGTFCNAAALILLWRAIVREKPATP